MRSSPYAILWHLYFCSLFFAGQPLLLWFSGGILFPHIRAQIQIVFFVTSTYQMPSLKMKSEVGTTCLTERKDLHVCPKSKAISKKTCAKVIVSAEVAGIDTTIQNCLDGKQLNLRWTLSSLFCLSICVNSFSLKSVSWFVQNFPSCSFYFAFLFFWDFMCGKVT